MNNLLTALSTATTLSFGLSGRHSDAVREIPEMEPNFAKAD